MSVNLVEAEPQALPLNRGTAIAIVSFHLLSVAALFMFSWQALAATIVLWWVSGSLGIGLGYHRLLTHRGFKTSKWFEYFLTLCGMLALESGAINWVATHRIHHKFTEEIGHDPHTPREGFWWSHIGWILRGTAQQHEWQTLERYAPDLTKDPVHRALNRIYFVPLIILGFALLIFGGWSVMLWGVFLRVTIGWHVTWLVNSATHKWGSRRFETGDDSTNNFLVALFTFGEGWHNNHHAHPVSARHGLRWHEIDLNWYAICAFEKLRLIHSVKTVNRIHLHKQTQRATSEQTSQTLSEAT
jgi:fatty-acid desaturase